MRIIYQKVKGETMKMLILNADEDNTYEYHKEMDVIIKCDGITITILKSSNRKMVPEGTRLQQTNENMQKIIAYFV